MIREDLHRICSYLKDLSFEDQTVLITGGLRISRLLDQQFLLEKNAGSSALITWQADGKRI